MTDIQGKLNSLKAEIERGKSEKAKAEANLQTYTQQKDEVVKEMAGLGVKPEDVEAEIEKLEGEIQDGLSRAETLVRGE